MAAVDEITANTQALNASTTPDQRMAWNGLLDKLKGQPVTPEAIAAHAQTNPGFPITPEMLPKIQEEQRALRSGNSFGPLTGDQLNVARTGMSTNFINQTDLSQSRYPQFKVGGKDYGTDIESYIGEKEGVNPIAAPPPTGVNPLPINKDALPNPGGPKLIPRLNYNDPASHTAFLNDWQKQYGNLEGRGDTVLKVDQVPRGGSDSIKNISIKAAKPYGIDPALLYSSAMEEGASGLFKDLSGKDTKGRKPGEFGYQDFYGDKAFPINGGQSFGFQTFAEKFPDLVRGGYLPKEFASQFRGVKAALGDDAEYANANNFKTVEGAMQAKAAMMKFGEDYIEKEAQKRNIYLSPKQKEFFTLAWFNGGEGAILHRLPDYAKKGYLKNDDFINKRPVEEQGKPDNLDVWGHVTRRIKMAQNLKEQKMF